MIIIIIIILIILILLYLLINNIINNKDSFINIKNKKLALLFLIYDEINQEDLWHDYLKNIDKNKYSIYIHYKIPPTDKKLKYYEENKINSIETKWGDLSLVKAQNVLLGEALKDENNTSFIFLSNSCIPLKKFDTIYNSISSDYSYFNITYKNIYPRYNKILKFTDKDNILKASQWSILCRKHAEILYNDKDIYYNWYEGVDIPDEGAYITYLNHKNVTNELITIVDSTNNSTTFTNWGGKDYKYSDSGSPKFYDKISNEEINYLVNESKCFFGRKFKKECDLSYLKKLII